MKKQRGKTPVPAYACLEPKASRAEDSGKLSRDEKRRLIAQMVRLNPADCFDVSGTLDLELVREYSGAAVQQMIVHEITRTDKEGNIRGVQRRITLKLVDKVRAMNFDEKLLEREEAEQANEMSEERKKEFEEAQERARAILKEKLLGPDWPEWHKMRREDASDGEAEESVSSATSASASPARPPPF